MNEERMLYLRKKIDHFLSLFMLFIEIAELEKGEPFYVIADALAALGASSMSEEKFVQLTNSMLEFFQRYKQEIHREERENRV